MKNNNEDYIIGMTSTTQEAAELIAETIVEKKIAACVQIMGPVTSFYWWKGKIQKDTEAVLLIKTKKHCVSHIKQIIKKIHPYELPELLFIPVIEGTLEYFKWIDTIVNNTP